MENVLLIISLVLNGICITLVVFLLLKKRNETGEWREPLRRVEEQVSATARLTDYIARTEEASAHATEARLANIQNRLADDIKYIVESNAQNLDRIRRTVDEKLTSSIDGKLTESYKVISERLEKMYESAGEMRALSGNVAEIRRVFANVKLRGTWGEAQLDTLLSQMLAPTQYARSVKLDPLGDLIVDFAVILPSKKGETVYLPIDSKFPVEEFERLQECAERGDKEGEERARKNLERAVKLQADSIAKKYIRPPQTSDFAVMYLPSEGVYAEIARYAGLTDFLRSRRVIACGPTNFGALLSILQTGFRSAAIEKRSGELIEMLDVFRRDFAEFSALLDKTRKKLKEAQDSVESAEKRTASIGRTLDSFRAEEGEE